MNLNFQQMKTQEQLQEEQALISRKLRMTEIQESLLQTQWWVLRNLETGVVVPADVAAERTALYAELDQLLEAGV